MAARKKKVVNCRKPQKPRKLTCAMCAAKDMVLAAKNEELERVYSLVRDLQRSAPPIVLAEASAARRNGLQEVTPMDTLAEEAKGQQELDAEGWDGDELEDPPVEGAILLSDMYEEFARVHGPDAPLHLAGLLGTKPPEKVNAEG